MRDPPGRHALQLAAPRARDKAPTAQKRIDAPAQGEIRVDFDVPGSLAPAD